jgi:hypothetical protein
VIRSSVRGMGSESERARADRQAVGGRTKRAAYRVARTVSPRADGPRKRVKILMDKVICSVCGKTVRTCDHDTRYAPHEDRRGRFCRGAFLKIVQEEDGSQSSLSSTEGRLPQPGPRAKR